MKIFVFYTKMYICGWKKVAHNISEAYEYDKKFYQEKIILLPTRP